MKYKIVKFDESILQNPDLILDKTPQGRKAPEKEFQFKFVAIEYSVKHGKQLVFHNKMKGFIVVKLSEIPCNPAYYKFMLPAETIPFSIEAWETGKYDAVTRGGRKVNEVFISKAILSLNQGCPIIYILDSGARYSAYANGIYMLGIDKSDYDLFLLEKSTWIN